MSFTGQVFEILIASPGDVPDERRLAHDTILNWTKEFSRDSGTVLLPVMWEFHAAPRIGARPQEVINKQVVERSDALIGIFWTRLGTPTGEAESGTAEEIEKIASSGKPTMLYFSSKPVALDNLDQEQLSKLRSFREKLSKQGLIETFQTLDELRQKLMRHLGGLAKELSPEGGLEAAPQISQGDDRDDLIDQADRIIRGSEVRWNAERDSSPMGVEEGKQLLLDLGEQLAEVRVDMLGKFSEESLKEADRLLKLCRKMQQHQLYIDGGSSYRAFWEQGTELYRQAGVWKQSLRQAKR